jgi:integrase
VLAAELELLLELLLETVGIAGAGLHSLPHSFVSRLVEENVPVTFAQKLVGHSRVETTSRTTSG